MTAGPLRRRTLLLAAGPLALALLIAAWAVRSARPEKLAHRYPPGRRLVYRLEYVSASASDFSGLLAEGKPGEQPSSGLSHSVHAAAQGELEVTVLGRQGERVHLAYRLRKPEVQLAIDGQLDAERGRAIQGELARALLAEVGPSGRVLAVRLGADGSASAFTRALLSAVQVVLPGNTTGGWEVEEDGPGGTCVARYEARPAGQRGTFCLRKRTLRYLSARRPAEDVSDIEARMELRPGGEREALVDGRRGWVVSLTGTETTATVLQQRTVAHSETTVSLTLLREEAVRQEERASLRDEGMGRAAAFVALSEREGEEATETALQRAELGTATADDLLAELARAERAPAGQVDETALYLKFKALVYLQPGVSARLGHRLASAQAGGPTLRVLTQALSAAGRAPAQAALAEVVLQRRDDWPALAEMVPALGLAREPTPGAETALRELAARARNEDVRSTAQLALGLMARNLSSRHPARADGIVRWALAELAGARHAGERRQFLLVLGNTGSALAWPALRGHLSAAEPEVRGAAVAALRGLEGRDVESALCRALKDAHASVRLEAALALAARRANEAIVAALVEALGRDEAVTVRLAVLNNLAQARAAFPEAERALRQAGQSTVKEVREAAQQLLAEGAK
jgi:hypothetical protein